MSQNVKILGLDFTIVNQLEDETMNKVVSVISNNEEYLSENTSELESDKINYLMENFQVLGKGACGVVIALNDNLALKFNYTESYNTIDGKVLELLQGAPMTLELYLYSNDNRYMIVERVHGETISNVSRLSLSKNIEEQLAKREAYEKSFDKFIEHCLANNVQPKDMHTGNVMLTYEGDFKIVDYGLFRIDQKFLTKAGLMSENYCYKRDIIRVCKFYRRKFIEKALEPDIAEHSKALKVLLEKAKLNEGFINRMLRNLRQEMIDNELKTDKLQSLANTF